MKALHIAPNIPLYVALKNPEGEYDFDLQVGRYETTTGQQLTLPRPAVILLNALDSRPGEELQIVKRWSGKAGEPATWTVALAHQSEIARAEAGEPDTLTAALQASIAQVEERKATQPTPIRKPAIVAPAESQPKLFDQVKGTGTHGPAIQPAPAAPVPAIYRATAKRAEPIPWNVAFREVSKWVSRELAGNSLQWSDEAQQAMVCTVLIAEVKTGRIGPWERGE